jgi:hypothetical protein
MIKMINKSRFCYLLSISALVLFSLCSCSKSENPSKDGAQTQASLGEAKEDGLSKGPDDVGLICKSEEKGSNQQMYVLIYSPKYNVGKFGPEKEDGTWDPRYRINAKDSTLQEVTFDVTSYDNIFVKNLNPQAEINPEKIIVDRKTLDLRYETNGKYVGYLRMNYKCDLLQGERFTKHIQWVLDNTEKQKQQNKI